MKTVSLRAVSVLLFLLGSTLVWAEWFGLESCPSHWAVATGYADACRFQATEDGTSTRLEIRTWSSSGSKATFRMAVYDDEDGHPANRLWESTDVAYQAGEWCGEDVDIIHLTQGAYFWLAFKASEFEEICYVGNGPAGSHEWKAGQAYGDAFPNPWGSYSGRNSNRYTMRMHYIGLEGTRGIIETDAGAIEGGFVR